MINGQWSWNYPNSDWWNKDQFDTKEEAIADAKENYGVHEGDIRIGQCYSIPLPTDVDADIILEYLNQDYAEDLSEWDDNLFEFVTNEQQEELENMLSDTIKKWYKKVGIKSKCWNVDNISTIHVD